MRAKALNCSRPAVEFSRISAYEVYTIQWKHLHSALCSFTLSKYWLICFCKKPGMEMQLTETDNVMS